MPTKMKKRKNQISRLLGSTVQEQPNSSSNKRFLESKQLVCFFFLAKQSRHLST